MLCNYAQNKSGSPLYTVQIYKTIEQHDSFLCDSWDLSDFLEGYLTLQQTLGYQERESSTGYSPMMGLRRFILISYIWYYMIWHDMTWYFNTLLLGKNTQSLPPTIPAHSQLLDICTTTFRPAIARAIPKLCRYFEKKTKQGGIQRTTPPFIP